MIVSIPVTQPFGTAIWQKARRFMDVILHIGAHRCATTSFQHYMRTNKDPLNAAGVGFWGPMRTRSGLFRGIQPGPEIKLNRNVKQRAMGRVRLQCAKTSSLGVHTLLVSDENMLGTMRRNIAFASLYGGAGERIARFAEAFGGYLKDITLNIRSPEFYWASVFGFAAEHGRGLPSDGLLERIVETPRSWRDVIADVACAAPGAQIHVLPFEQFSARPDWHLAQVTECVVPAADLAHRQNATLPLERLREVVTPSEGVLPEGQGRWMPFSEAQCAILRERYADDLMWLEGGADGLARLARGPDHKKAGNDLPHPDMTRGRRDDKRHGQVARAGRERAARQAS